MDLGDINGDGNTSGLPDAPHVGNTVKVKHPEVRLIGSSSITQQVREEIFTVNARGLPTTHTDPEGNLTVTVYYPYNDPEGDGRFVAAGLSSKQYGNVKEVHVDADPDDVMSLIGSDGDLIDFIPGKITRTNTPGVYQDLVTRYEGSSTCPGGGCAACAYDQLGNPLAVTDARGFTTLTERNELGETHRTISADPYRYQRELHYDANRNVVRTDIQDQFVQYQSQDPTDAGFGHFNPSGSHSTANVPSKTGHSGRQTRPGWFTNFTTYNLLDDVTEEDIDATGSHPSSLITTHEYDANQNPIKTTQPEGNTVEFDYDERNLQIAQRVGNSPDTPAVSITAYDGNGNLMQVIGPAARGAAGNHQTVTLEDAFDSGAQLVHTGDFTLENTYDGFDRVVTAKDAVGNVADTNGTLGDPCLDPDGRTIKTTDQGPIGGATPTNRNGTNNVDLTQSLARYDEAGRQYESQHDVFLATGTTLPSSRTITHTGGGLETNSTANTHTGTVTLTSAGQSYVLTRTVQDRAGRIVEQIADNTAVAEMEYDGANREIKVTDALGNFAENEHDANSNVILTTRTEKCTITEPTVADETFRSAMQYDSLNRLVVQAQQGADGTLDTNFGTAPADSETLFTRFGYDSRSNQTLAIDPKGNSTVTVYDGANRTIQVQQHLRQDGQGDAPPEPNQTFLAYGGASVTTTTLYDGNSRPRQLIDDNGNVTTWSYDTLNRETVMTFHNGSTRTNVFNTASNVTTYTDENGSVFTNTYDPLGRKTAVSISLASGVVGTTAQSFEFDGISRATFLRDSVTTTHADVTKVYDSLSRILEDSQTFGGNIRNVTNEEFTSYPTSQFAFPDGRQTNNAYDLLYRRTLVEETSGGADIAEWEFFGPTRIAECTLGNGLICTWMSNARTRSAVQDGQSSPSWGDQSSDRLGYDGTGRMITKRFLDTTINGTTHAYDNTTALVGQTTAFDKASNKLYERELHAENRSHLYQPITNSEPQGGYDSLDRLRQYQRGTLASGGGSITTPITLPGTDKSRTYDLDGLGNWHHTVYTPVGGSETDELRQHNGLNQITSTDDGATDTNFSYDGATGASNGNLADDGIRTYKWDALNRLKEVRKKNGRCRHRPIRLRRHRPPHPKSHQQRWSQRRDFQRDD